jgi:hypothetical protein
MATCQSETVNSVPQVPDYHAERFPEYCAALVRLANVTGEIEGECDEAQRKADRIFTRMMNAPAGSVAAVMFKAKAAALECYNYSETVVSPRVYGELFNMLAAELETILAAEAAGKAVRS